MLSYPQSIPNNSFPKPTSNNLPTVDISTTPQNSLGTFSTLNSHGYMLNYLHKLNRTFVEYSATAPGPVLDIGTAYGFVTLEALKRGACVIANDLESRHLEDLHKRVPECDLNRISYALGRVPGEISFSPNSLGAVLASGVLHYLSPLDFSLAIANIANWLKPCGKFFMATPSPYTNLYQKFLPTFQKNREKNEQWPGYIADATKILPSFFTNVPKSIYLMDEEFIEKILEENGFRIESIYFFNIKLPTAQYKLQTKYLGVIATKL